MVEHGIGEQKIKTPNAQPHPGVSDKVIPASGETSIPTDATKKFHEDIQPPIPLKTQDTNASPTEGKDQTPKISPADASKSPATTPQYQSFLQNEATKATPKPISLNTADGKQIQATERQLPANPEMRGYEAKIDGKTAYYVPSKDDPSVMYARNSKGELIRGQEPIKAEPKVGEHWFNDNRVPVQIEQPRKKETTADTPGVLVPQQDTLAKQTSQSDASKNQNYDSAFKSANTAPAVLARGSVEFTESAKTLSQNKNASDSQLSTKPDAVNSQHEFTIQTKDLTQQKSQTQASFKNVDNSGPANSNRAIETSEHHPAPNDSRSLSQKALTRADVQDMISRPVSNTFAEGVKQLSTTTGKIVDAIKAGLPPEAAQTAIAFAGGINKSISDNVAAGIQSTKQILGAGNNLTETIKSNLANTDLVKGLDAIKDGGTKSIRTFLDTTAQLTQGTKEIIGKTDIASAIKNTLTPNDTMKGFVSALATIAENVKNNIVGSAAGGKYIWIALAGIADITKPAKPSTSEKNQIDSDQSKRAPREIGNQSTGNKPHLPEKNTDNRVTPSLRGDETKDTKIADKISDAGKIRPTDKPAADKTTPLVAKPATTIIPTDKTNPLSTEKHINPTTNISKNRADSDKTSPLIGRPNQEPADRTIHTDPQIGTRRNLIGQKPDSSFDHQQQTSTHWDKSLYISRFPQQMITRLKEHGYFEAINRNLQIDNKQTEIRNPALHNQQIEQEKKKPSSADKLIPAQENPQPNLDEDKSPKKDELDQLALNLDNTFIEISPIAEDKKKTAEIALPKQYEAQSRYKLRTNSRTRRQYYVNKGDTLESIAEYFYADKSVAAAIFYLNRKNIPVLVYKGSDYAYLQASTILPDKQISRIECSSI